MTWEVRQGDALVLMATLAAGSVDAVVTDPPYGLSFMGKEWDRGVPGVPFWEAALHAAKPGAHLVAFGGTRTYHRLTCAIEDAGWEVRDCLSWLYGSGFPKSLDVSKAIDKAAGAGREVVGRRDSLTGRNKATNTFMASPRMMDVTGPATDAAHQWAGWGTALKPAWEPIILARKPLDGTVAANVQEHGTGALNVDATRVPTSRGGVSSSREGSSVCTCHERAACRASRSPSNEPLGARETGPGPHTGPRASASERASVRPSPQDSLAGCRPSDRCDGERTPAFASDDEAGAPQRVDARKPRVPREEAERNRECLSTCAHCTTRDVESLGRWPANVVLDEEAAALLDEQSGESRSSVQRLNGYANKGTRHEGFRRESHKAYEPFEAGYNDAGGASRFFYTAKASSGERHYAGKNAHPTVKPVDLMRWLCRLVTPKGGLVLDPFMGSGSTGVAALAEGFRFVGFDLDPEWCEVARRRIAGPLFAQEKAQANDTP